MQGILLSNYSNYYNRFVKYEETLTDYLALPNAKRVGDTQGKIFNFNPGDGVNTSHVFDFYWEENFTPDYLVVHDGENIISRWFVTACIHISGDRKFRCELHRDLIVDYYDHIKTAPCYVERAMVGPLDVAMYNQEPGLLFNQIKKSETLLKDRSGCGWVVGYYEPLANDLEVNIPTVQFTDYISVNNIADWVEQYDNKVKILTTKINYYYSYRYGEERGDWKQDIDTITPETTFQVVAYALRVPNWDSHYRVAQYVYKNSLSLKNQYKALDPLYIDNDVAKYNDKIIYDRSSGIYYKIKVTTQDYTHDAFENVNSTYSNYFNSKVANETGSEYRTTSSSRNIEVILTGTRYSIEYTVYTPETSSLKVIIPANAAKLNDAPYSMFAIPYESVELSGGGYKLFDTVEKEEAINIATNIGKQLGTCYDLQLLPFAPLQDRFLNDHQIVLDDLESNDYSFVTTSSNERKGIVLFSRSSNSLKTIKLTNPITKPVNTTDIKLVNQCDYYRLVSPNYGAILEFNPIRTGTITEIQVDMTLKPHTPFIQLRPNWGELYGANFEDTRGLILQGDFSIPMMNDNWVQYTIQNKNYLNIFNRQIDSMELNNKYAKVNDLVTAGVGTLQGAASGAAIGSVAGPIGAVAGAAVGGIASLAGGIADININQKLRNEQMSLTLDSFNYSIQNIKALPQTLAKISSYDRVNKVFPLIEYYTCTDQEKEYFLDSIEYNGMTIDRIDKMEAFLPGYFKGYLIRCEGISDNSYIVQCINAELMKGVYL